MLIVPIDRWYFDNYIFDSKWDTKERVYSRPFELTELARRQWKEIIWIEIWMQIENENQRYSELNSETSSAELF